MDQPACLCPGQAGGNGCGCTVSLDHLLDRQATAFCEGDIELIMGWNTHHRPGSVLSQHIVGNPDGQLLVGERVGDRSTNGYTSFRSVIAGAFQGAQSRDVLLKRSNSLLVLWIHQLIDQRVLRCKNQITRSSQGVRSCGEHRDRCGLVSRNRKADFGPL